MQLAISGMLFRPMAQPAAQAKQPAQLTGQALYNIHWRASSLLAGPPASLLACSSIAVRGQQRSLRLPLGMPAAATAAALLASLQQGQLGSRVQLSAGAAIAGGTAASTAALGACTGLLRVAARELPAVSCSTVMVASTAPRRPAASAGLSADVFGLRAASGVWLAPQLASTELQPATQNAQQGSHLVLGGTGDIGSLAGLYSATCSSSARITLAGRTGRRHMPWLLQLGQGTQLTVTRCDAGSAEECASLLAQHSTAQPLHSVLHAGGVVQDAALSKQTAASLRAVMAPKASAALHLAQSIWGQPIARSVAFSSMSGLLGTPGQANYAAANSMLDALAARSMAAGERLGDKRRVNKQLTGLSACACCPHVTGSVASLSQARIALLAMLRIQLGTQCAGLPSRSVLWGPWATGMAATDARIGASFQRAGMALLQPQQGLRLLQAVLCQPASSAAAVLAGNVQWARLLAQQRPVPGIFAEVLAAEVQTQPHLQPQSAKPASPAARGQQIAAPAAVVRTSPAAASIADLQRTVMGVVHDMLGHAVSADEVRLLAQYVSCYSC